MHVHRTSYYFTMSTSVSAVITAIRSALQQRSNKTNSQAYEKYMKNVLKFYGLKAPELNVLFKDLYTEQIEPLSTKDKLELAYELFESKMGEEKNIGSLILTKNVKLLGSEHLPRLADLVDEHVYDWATCDRLSCSVIFHMIKQDKTVPSLLAKWKDAENVWRKRVSCVSFVKHARHGKYNDIIYDICATTVKCNERFVQLGAGWVLRELSLADLTGVKSFIKTNYDHMSREGLRYAIEKMTPQDKAKLLAYTGSASSEEISEILSEDEDLVVSAKGKKSTSRKRKIEEVESSDEVDDAELQKPIRTRAQKLARRT